MQFQVPQFIETEDKIIGPFSMRQFAFIGTGGILSAILYFVAVTWLWALGSLIIFGIAVSLAFVKIEGRPFASVIVSAFNFYWKPQTYVWQPEHPTASLPKERPKKEESSSLERILEQAEPRKRVFPAIQHPVVKAEKPAPEVVASKPAEPVKRVEPVVKHPAVEIKPAAPVIKKSAAVMAARPSMYAAKPAEPVTRESVSVGNALHKIWENVQTGSPDVDKNSDKQFLEKKMEERYQIFQHVAGDRNAAKRIDYR